MDLDFDIEDDDTDDKLVSEPPAHSGQFAVPSDLDSISKTSQTKGDRYKRQQWQKCKQKQQLSDAKSDPATKSLASDGQTYTEHSPEHTPTVTWTTSRGLEDYNTPINAVCFSLNERSLTFVSDDRVVRVWSVDTLSALTSQEGHRSRTRSLDWSYDGSRCSCDRTAKVWDVATWQNLQTLAGHRGAVSGLLFSPRAIYSLSLPRQVMQSLRRGREYKMLQSYGSRSRRLVCGHVA